MTNAKFRPRTYLHEGHPAFTMSKTWESTDAPGDSRVLWPKVRPGDVARCGTCDEPVDPYPREPMLIAPVPYLPS